MVETLTTQSGMRKQSNLASDIHFVDSDKKISLIMENISEVPEDLNASIGNESAHDRISVFNIYDKMKDGSVSMRNPFIPESSILSQRNPEIEVSFSPSSSSISSISRKFEENEKKRENKNKKEEEEIVINRITLPVLASKEFHHEEGKKDIPKLMLSPAQEDDGKLPRPQTIFEIEDLKNISKQSSRNEIEEDDKQLKFKLRTFGGKRRHQGRSTNLNELKILKIGTFMKVRRFTRILKLSSQSFKFKKLNEFHLKILDRESAIHYLRNHKRQKHDEDKEITFVMMRKKTLSPKDAPPLWLVIVGKILTKLFENLRNISTYLIEQFLNKIKVIEPENHFRITWSFVFIFFTIFSIIYFPLKIFFLENYYFYDYLIYFLINLLNILLTLNSALYSKGHLVKSRWKILKKYAKNKLLIDFLNTASPIVMIIKHNDIESLEYQIKLRFYMFFLICVFLKFFDLGKMFHDAVDHIRFRNKNAVSLIKMVKLFLIVVCSAHWIGCSWFLVALYQSEYLEGTWVSKQNLNDKSWFEQYVTCLYYASVTMLTVGYGDITPVNLSEKVFSIFILFIACGLFGFTMNTIGLILGEMDRQASSFNKKIRVLNLYMEDRKFDQQLQNKIRKFLTYVWKYENQEKMETDSLLQMIPNSFQEEVLLAINGKIVREVKLFKTLFPDEIVQKLSLVAKETTVPPDFLIYEEKDIDLNPNAYMLSKGSLEFYLGKNNSAIILDRHWSKSDPFGLVEFFLQIPREFSVKSIGFSTVISISHNDLITTLKSNRLANEKYRMLVDSCLNYDEYHVLDIPCRSCKGRSHLLKSCPYLLYCPSKDTVIQKYEFSVPHLERRTYTKRRKEKTRNAYISFESLSKIATNFTKNSEIRSKQDFITEESDEFSEDSEETYHEKSSKSELKNQTSLREDLLPEPFHLPPTITQPQNNIQPQMTNSGTNIILHPDLNPTVKEKENHLGSPNQLKRMSLMQQPKRRYSAMAPDLKRTSNPENILLMPHHELNQGKSSRRGSNKHNSVKTGTASATANSMKKIDANYNSHENNHNKGMTQEELERNIDSEKENCEINEEKSVPRRRAKDRKFTVRSLRKDEKKDEKREERKDEKKDEKEVLEEDETDSFIKESVILETVYSFTVYYPKNNIDVIIAQIHTQNLKNLQKRARRKEKQAILRKSHLLNKGLSTLVMNNKKNLVNFETISKIVGHLSPSRSSGSPTHKI